MTIYADLHLHSYYSDGRAAPEEILRHAASLNLKALALTDHDNLAGVAEAAAVADEFGIELIPAVELTTRWDGCGDPAQNASMERDIDVLGYSVELTNLELQNFVAGAQADIHARLQDCCQTLTAAGYPVTFDEVLEQNPRAGSALKLAKTLQNKGYAASYRQAVALFEAHWERVRLSANPIQQAIAAIHAAGGLAVLAHPTAVHCDAGWLGAVRVAELVDLGLDGLEIYHPRLNRAARTHFLHLARRFGLLVSGGSDDHGWPVGFPRMGSEPVTAEIVARLRRRRPQ